MTTQITQELLQQSRNNYINGIAEEERKNFDEANKYFTLASDNLFELAEKSKGKLKETRFELAMQMIDKASSLTSVKEKPPIFRVKNAEKEDDPISSIANRDKTDIGFSDVAGLEEVKEQIRTKLLYPFSHKKIAEKYGITPGGGILLYGPPGTGKTMIARAIAGEVNAAFFAIKPSEIMSQWVGKAEKNIEQLFVSAEKFPLSVIFFDEIEALAPSRRSSQSTVMKRVVTQLLAELDGFQRRTNVRLFIGATNEPWSIDSAILRPGRLDRLIYVSPPDSVARKKILEINLGEVDLSKDIDMETIVYETDGFSGADMASLAKRVKESVFLDAINIGIHRPIKHSDFLDVLDSMGPSVSKKDIIRFENFEN